MPPERKPEPVRTVILGLGNPIVSDDAVGLHVVAAVGRIIGDPLPDHLAIRESQRGGFELVELLAGFDRAILVDALELPDPIPGRVRRLTMDDVSGSVRLVGVHEVTVGHAFELGEISGVPMPKDVRIFAVEGKDMRTIAEQLTPDVAASIEPLAKEIVELVTA